MPKPSTNPILYDHLKTVNISILKKHGYLVKGQCQRGTLTWSINGIKTGSISIHVDMRDEDPSLVLDYKCNETPINYRVRLVSIQSNIGNGVIWYFICPHTSKMCRKLYLVNAYFYHRSAFTGCMYEKQTQSRKGRELDKAFGSHFDLDNLYGKIYRKHFKKKYAGKPTKEYLCLTERIQKAESIPYQEIERLMIK